MNQIKGKNKRRQLTCYDEIHNVTLSVDSAEEVDFVHWLNEACKLSVIQNFVYQPNNYVLFESEKYNNVFGKEYSLFQEHIYSPDFMVMFNPQQYIELAKEFHVPYSELSNSNCSVIIDVKGTFQRNDAGRSFSINQKWLWQKFKVYVYKLIPTKFFKLFGVPSACVYTQKTKKPRKMFQGLKLLKDIFN